MKSLDFVASLIDDFVFHDRRVVDQPAVTISAYLGEGNYFQHSVTSSNSPFAPPPYQGIVVRDTEDLFSRVQFIHSEQSSAHGLPIDEQGTRILSVIEIDHRPAGVLLFRCPIGVWISPVDSTRLQVLGALIGYEARHLRRRIATPSPASRDLARVLRSAREELGLRQSELAEAIGTSRIALTRWESGAQPPTRGPLLRWATALGLLAGGRPEIVRVVDATPQLIQLLRREPDRLHDLSPDQFERFVADRLEHMGYDVQRTGSTASKDGGIDIIAVPRFVAGASFLVAVQAKHHRGRRSTGRDTVDRLLAWQNSEFRLGMLVTNTQFTRDAVWKASCDPAKHFLRLRDFGDLIRWIHGAFESDAERREIPDSIELAPGVVVRVPRPRFSEAESVWPLTQRLEFGRGPLAAERES